jgi:hypothetical protein
MTGDRKKDRRGRPPGHLLDYTRSSSSSLPLARRYRASPDAALQEARKLHPLDGPAFGSMVDAAAHRDYLDRTNATYK